MAPYQQLSSVFASIVGLVLVLVEKASAQNCTGFVCSNGGVCNTFTASPPCICPLPYIPPYCSAAANYCNTLQPEKDITALPVCQNGGNCTMAYTDPYFNCTCPSGYSGIRCNTSTTSTTTISADTTTFATTTTILTAAVTTLNVSCTGDCTILSTASIIAIAVCVPVVVIVIVGTLIYVCVFKRDPNRVSCKPSDTSKGSQDHLHSHGKPSAQQSKGRTKNPSFTEGPIDETHNAQGSNGRENQKQTPPERQTDEAHYGQISIVKDKGKEPSLEHPTHESHNVDDPKGRHLSVHAQQVGTVYGQLPTLMPNPSSANENVVLEKIPSNEIQSVKQEGPVKKKRRRKRPQQEPLPSRSIDTDQWPGGNLPISGEHEAPEPEGDRTAWSYGDNHSPPIGESQAQE